MTGRASRRRLKDFAEFSRYVRAGIRLNYGFRDNR